MTDKPHVLIVDDEQVVRDLLLEELVERGYSCTAASSGEEALSRIRIEHFDLVLLDIKLPKMSGMEVLGKMHGENPVYPVVMLTAMDDVETAVEAMKLGACDYITKPFELSRVDECLRDALRMREMRLGTMEMDAIAQGVESRVNPSGDLKSLVTNKTVETARQLGMADEAIQKWVAAQAQKKTIKPSA